MIPLALVKQQRLWLKGQTKLSAGNGGGADPASPVTASPMLQNYSSLQARLSMCQQCNQELWDPCLWPRCVPRSSCHWDVGWPTAVPWGAARLCQPRTCLSLRKVELGLPGAGLGEWNTEGKLLVLGVGCRKQQALLTVHRMDSCCVWLQELREMPGRSRGAA